MSSSNSPFEIRRLGQARRVFPVHLSVDVQRRTCAAGRWCSFEARLARWAGLGRVLCRCYAPHGIDRQPAFRPECCGVGGSCPVCPSHERAKSQPFCHAARFLQGGVVGQDSVMSRFNMTPGERCLAGQAEVGCWQVFWENSLCGPRGSPDQVRGIFGGKQETGAYFAPEDMFDSTHHMDDGAVPQYVNHRRPRPPYPNRVTAPHFAREPAGPGGSNVPARGVNRGPAASENSKRPACIVPHI